MTKLVPVENNASMARDPNTQAIVSINIDELAQARLAKKLRRKKAKEYEQMKQDVGLLKNEISDIKDLLKKLVEK